MANKYVDAEMLISELDASCMPIFEKGISGILGDNESIADVIRSQPAADVQEVKRGEWLYNDLYLPFCAECSECGWKSSVNGDEIPGYFFCPRCGAKMDGEESE